MGCFMQNGGAELEGNSSISIEKLARMGKLQYHNGALDLQ